MVMIIRRLYTAWALLAFLQQQDPVASQRRALLTENGRFPCRRTWERRLQSVPVTLPRLIGQFGRYRVLVLNPWVQQGCGAAFDSTARRAHGGVWHKKHREQGVVPPTRIDPEAAWSKSGWHGWKLHLTVTIGRIGIPLAAELTPANTANSEMASCLLTELPLEVRYVLGDQHYNTPQSG